MRLPGQTEVMTAIVGSYPKPPYLLSETGRELLDSFGFDMQARRQEVGETEFTALLDRAAGEAIEDQNQAGLDLMTDGEERRGHYVMDILRGLDGLDFVNLSPIPIRGGTDTQNAPRVVDRLTYRGGIVLDEFRFTQDHTNGLPKIGLPGPTTAADCVADEYYGGDREHLAIDYADAIHHEVGALIEEGCKVIQFDDPVLLRYPDQAKKWGLAALERCFAGYEDAATFIVHICCGYPNIPFEEQRIAYKADKAYYRDVLSWLSESNLDVVSIEGAASNLDLSVLSAVGKKTIMLGVLNVAPGTMESVEELIARGREALQYIPASQLILAPDCGMVQLTRETASQKLQNMTQAAAELNHS